jgi:hypothetical protein
LRGVGPCEEERESWLTRRLVLSFNVHGVMYVEDDGKLVLRPGSASNCPSLTILPSQATPHQ